MSFLYTAQVIHDSTNSTYWNSQSFWPGTVVTARPPAEIEGSQLTVQFQRTVEVGLDEDRAMFRVHLAVDAGPGAPTVPLSTSQAVTVEENFLSRWNSTLGQLCQPRWTLAEFTWRNYGAAYPLAKDGTSKPGPIWRSSLQNLPGRAAGVPLADQLAATVTYRTPSRKHWGRTYWGGLTSDSFTGELMGKLAGTYVDSLAGNFNTWHTENAAEAAIVNLWVWSSRHRGLLSVTQIAVDDVPDVVRRRRAKNASYKKAFP